MTEPDSTLSAFLNSLENLDSALDENIRRTHLMKSRIRQLQQAVRAGRSLVDVVPQEGSPLLVQLLTECAESIHEAGSRVRRTEARALYQEGMTMEQIAALFGVTRQRVSALIREPEAGEAGRGSRDHRP
jgi:hypothetical protein